MDHERFFELLSAHRHSSWDFNWKLLTRDCPDCPFFFADPKVAPSVKLCLWGIAIKQLSDRRPKLRKCEYSKKISPREALLPHYIEYPWQRSETIESHRKKFREFGIEDLLD